MMNTMESDTSTEKAHRIYKLDELRGLLVLLMVIYHLLFDLAGYHYLRLPTSVAFTFILELGAALFFIISGFSSHLSHHLIRRSLITFGAGLLVFIVTWFIVPSEPIWFGVLQSIGVCGLLTSLLIPAFRKIGAPLGFTLSIVLFIASYSVSHHRLLGIALPSSLYGTKWLFWLGFPYQGFRSADYFPLLPWFFAYLCGFFLFALFKHGFPSWMYRKDSKFLSTAGRHTLLIYLLHQPIFIGIILFCQWIGLHLH